MKRKPLTLLLCFIFIFIFLNACSIEDLEKVLTDSNNQSELLTSTTSNTLNATNDLGVTFPSTNENFYDNKDLLQIFYIDVGQGDSILIVLPNGKSMLIDSGTSSSFETISTILDSQGITKIDVLIATHPHADHIGSMGTIINNYMIGKIYMPKVSSNTKTFENLLQTILDNGLKVIPAKAGGSIEIDDSVVINIIAPNSVSYSNLNNASIVFKLTYKNTSFLFTGDAESISEKEIMELDYDLHADIIKVAHHGSNSSTLGSLLQEVDPTYAIISVGKDNEYGLPKQKLLDRLADYGVTVYRTDELGTIHVTSDGDEIKISVFTKVGE